MVDPPQHAARMDQALKAIMDRADDELTAELFV
jgi:hypothetical protein